MCGATVSAGNRIRIERVLREAEGYLELGMPRQTLALLDRIEQPGTFKARILFLKGDALRGLESYQEAVPLLVDAVDLAPSNIHAWMALGWRYKRIGRLDEAIDSLELRSRSRTDRAADRLQPGVLLQPQRGQAPGARLPVPRDQHESAVQRPCWRRARLRSDPLGPRLSIAGQRGRVDRHVSMVTADRHITPSAR